MLIRYFFAYLMVFRTKNKWTDISYKCLIYTDNGIDRKYPIKTFETEGEIKG